MQNSIRRPSLDQLEAGILNGDRVLLSRAITLIESKRSLDQEDGSKLIDKIINKTGKSIRIGITGVPGVGKSTFIESFGKFLTSQGHKVAVLSVDPSSSRTKGSILGDKTRMNELATDPNAFIRPSPSGNFLGGVAQRTRESIFLCEAAGYDVIIVETVGVGQSETSVNNMVDFFLLLVIVGGGDELQGIKRGIMEMADMILINKIDDENNPEAKRTASEFKQALHLFPPKPNNWIVPVNTVSSLKKRGINEAWNEIKKYQKLANENESFFKNRANQNLDWFKEAIQSKLITDFFAKPGIKDEIASLNEFISRDKISIRNALGRLFEE